MKREIYEEARAFYLGWNTLYRDRFKSGKKGSEFIYIGCFTNRLPLSEGLKYNQRKLLDLRREYYK